ncbi:hypothetical protein P175DRAFT_0560455 [Aspergillus ochraceoroseus IBT 24754]|uniref:Regulator of volume decrease after cellular swelling-domain-containing protein n=1 Tax=Aspergillus ochraceoroseus IBT 24754 TaxID=1392256 RepID=A0A2T5LNA3_9EURO|nr:uncharacterized protein P175DRAFT_0560455 [Aspergillus ochraceoroseus IBT 24754]PTU17760.1 hypothetical protein P175DRAFT_0560455 [Aspergillus ochraceoroseus IBT 24754]
MESLTTPPETSSFIALSVHQSRTPDSFHSGPAILHYHSSHCKLVILDRDLISSPPLNALRGAAAAAAAAVNGNDQAETETSEAGTEIVIDGLDIWVTSDKFLVYNPSTSYGVSITYPSISLHAIQRLSLPAQDQVQGLYMQITKPPASSSYPQASDEEESITMTLVPPPPAASSSSSSSETKPETTTTTTTTMSSTGAGTSTSTPDIEQPEPESETPTQALYTAVSACSNLHPDPIEEAEEQGDGAAFASGLVFPGSMEGGLPPPMDGSSGWITAENMHEYFDEQGNWIGGGGEEEEEEEPSFALGPGAGTVRPRGEEDGEGEGEGEGNANGDGAMNGVEETKWRRTD